MFKETLNVTNYKLAAGDICHMIANLESPRLSDMDPTLLELKQGKIHAVARKLKILETFGNSCDNIVFQPRHPEHLIIITFLIKLVTFLQARKKNKSCFLFYHLKTDMQHIHHVLLTLDHGA